ncbi:hypothetical protein AB4Y45_32985 [Paraburkholderia sp. EG287A]|uniref:hypothetical protein n=1 Tax=Paraburkholderia sp. EG287A TaxID=3237012 RepID=UPI0034D18694
MSENRVETRMLIAPDELEGFAGGVFAFMVVRGALTQIACGTVYSERPARITYTVPETISLADVPELTRLLAEFAEKLQIAEEKAKT